MTDEAKTDRFAELRRVLADYNYAGHYCAMKSASGSEAICASDIADLLSAFDEAIDVLQQVDNHNHPVWPGDEQMPPYLDRVRSVLRKARGEQ